MYCPICLQNTLKIKSVGVVKLAFNNKSRNTSLFTYNLQKETHEQLVEKLREKIVDFFTFYGDFANKEPIKTFDVYSGDFQCSNNCKMSISHTKLSIVNLMFTPAEVKKVLNEEAKKFSIEIKVPNL